MHCGQIFGLLINGWAMERFGLKKTQCAALITMAAFIFVQFFAPSIAVLCIGELLIGFPLGVFLTLSTVYAVDVCPVQLRAYLSTYVNICWVIGKLIATGILRGFVHDQTQWAYRIPFAIQWVWAPIIFFGTLLAPESPWWLVRRGRHNEARRVMQRLWSSPTTEELDASVATMVQTNDYEKSLTAGNSYLDCFKGSNLYRTEIACVVYSIQPMCGFALAGSATYFMEQAGLAPANALNITLGGLGISFVGGLLVWILLAAFGRRTLYLWGLMGIFVTQMAIGFLAISPLSNGTAWATGVMLLFFNAVYSLSVGPITYSIVAETPSTRLRSKTAALGRNAYNIFTITNNIITNYQINATSWNWKGKAGFFWAGSCALCFCWAFFRLPETKGRTFAQLDVLFESGIRARDFSKTYVNIDQLSANSEVEKNCTDNVKLADSDQ